MQCVVFFLCAVPLWHSSAEGGAGFRESSSVAATLCLCVVGFVHAVVGLHIRPLVVRNTDDPSACRVDVVMEHEFRVHLAKSRHILVKLLGVSLV